MFEETGNVHETGICVIVGHIIQVATFTPIPIILPSDTAQLSLAKQETTQKRSTNSLGLGQALCANQSMAVGADVLDVLKSCE